MQTLRESAWKARDDVTAAEKASQEKLANVKAEAEVSVAMEMW